MMMYLSCYNVQDPLKTVKELNEYLGTSRSDEMCEEIVESTKFDNLKEAKLAKSYSHSVWGSLYQDKTASPYRKGLFIFVFELFSSMY